MIKFTPKESLMSTTRLITSLIEKNVEEFINSKQGKITKGNLAWRFLLLQRFFAYKRREITLNAIDLSRIGPGQSRSLHTTKPRPY